MSFFSALIGSLASVPLTAQLRDVLDQVGSDVPQAGCSGVSCIWDIKTALVGQLAPFALILGVIFMMIAGVRLLTKSDEGELANARKSVGIVFAGVVLSVLANEGVLFNAIDQFRGGIGASILCTEFLGLVSIFEGLAGLLALIAIVTTGIKSLASFGSEDAASSMRNAVFACIMGLFVLLAKSVVFPAIGIGSSCGLLTSISSEGPVLKVLSMVSTLLLYLQIAAVLILVFIGVMMIVRMGNDEEYERLKGYLFRLAIGFIILSMTKMILDIVIV